LGRIYGRVIDLFFELLRNTKGFTQRRKGIAKAQREFESRLGVKKKLNSEQKVEECDASEA
jgi:hypothetical protein